MTSLSPSAHGPFSMTGYGSAHTDCDLGRISFELKSVNSRFFEFSARMPEEFRWLEPLMRDRIGQAVYRGKVELRVSLARSEASLAATQINPQGLASALRLSHQIRMDHQEVSPLSVADLLRMPGVIREPELSTTQWQNLFEGLTENALAEFMLSRQKEGERLVAVISSRLDALSEFAHKAKDLVPGAITHQQKRLTERMMESLLGLSSATAATFTEMTNTLHERVRQEVSLFGLRIDVAEEIDRLESHITATRTAISPSEKTRSGIGKRIDFLSQEMNREANTLGSKSPSAELASLSIEMKLLIEQIREQAQNLQ